MIMLKIIKSILPICDVKKSNRAFVSKWQIDNFGALFLLKIKIKPKRELDSLLF